MHTFCLLVQQRHCIWSVSRVWITGSLCVARNVVVFCSVWRVAKLGESSGTLMKHARKLRLTYCVCSCRSDASNSTRTITPCSIVTLWTLNPPIHASSPCSVKARRMVTWEVCRLWRVFIMVACTSPIIHLCSAARVILLRDIAGTQTRGVRRPDPGHQGLQGWCVDHSHHEDFGDESGS